MLEKINHIMGTATPFAVLLAGLLFAFLLRGLPFSRPVQCAKALRGNKGEASSLKGLALALAGTLGVGNIVGVASAIALGGPGAIFWMWVSAVAAMFLKYAEVVLGVKFRESLSDGTHRGGAPFYIRAILSKRFSPGVGRGAAVFFALLCLANAFTMGCVIQSNAVGSAITNAFGFSPLSVGLFLALISLPLLFRGHRAVSAATSLLVPLMSGVFFSCPLRRCIFVMTLSLRPLPPFLRAPFPCGAPPAGRLASPLSAPCALARCAVWSPTKPVAAPRPRHTRPQTPKAQRSKGFSALSRCLLTPS